MASVNNPRLLSLWHRLAHLLVQRGDKRKAFKALHNGLLVDPSNSACALAQATLLLEAGQPEAALKAVNALLKHQPEQIAALQRKAEILQFMGELEASLTLCRRGLQQEPTALGAATAGNLRLPRHSASGRRWTFNSTASSSSCMNGVLQASIQAPPFTSRFHRLAW